MKKKTTTTHWPRHLYLVASGSTREGQHPPSPESMGSKAYNLLRMAQAGLPVPAAMVIGTHYTQAPEDCALPVFSVGLPALEEVTGQTFGDFRNPLIVSVRSGAPVSMPGMMETLLNVGLCDSTLPGLLRQTGNPRMVWDAYRRLVASYGEVVVGLPAALFEQELQRLCGDRDERELDFSELRDLTHSFLAIYEEGAGKPFPQDVHDQLSGAIQAVFASWNADKAREYRELNHIDPAMGTAVTVQRMVFGNTGGHSGAGVGFTRDPSTGDKRLWVDFLVNAQGEDVVSGRRNAHGHATLASVAPDAWRELQVSAQALEQQFLDMQDFEFTVQDGALHLLQSRNGKRTPLAAARIAFSLMDEGVIDTPLLLERTAGLKEEDLGVVRLQSAATSGDDVEPLGTAMSACTGVVSGEIALDGERAAARAKAGAKVVLVRQDAETSDIAAMEASVGLLTQRGARTSHAAVVARQLGKVCLVGCSRLQIDAAARSVRLGDMSLQEGDVITLDGNDGSIYPGEVAAVMVPDTDLIVRLRKLRAVHQHTAKVPRHQGH